MTPKYHINPATGRPGICRAKNYCRFANHKEHFETKDDARVFYENKMKKQEIAEAKKRAPLTKKVMAAGVVEKALPPIKIKPTKANPPLYYDSYLIDATDVEPIDYYTPDSYTDFTYVDGVKAVEKTIGLKRENWPDELVKIYEDHEQDWNDASKWDVEFGYYPGEDPTITPPSDFRTTLTDWYYSQPNATDHMGVLEHVRGKGHDTSGLTPVEAVKKMLREENEVTLPWIEDANRVNRHSVKFSDLRINSKHYDEAKADPKETFTTSNQKNLGVVHWSKTDGYKLLNGYNRLKAAKDNNETEADFIVIHRW